MNLKEFEREYLNILNSQDNDKTEKLIQLVSDNIENMEIPTDYITKVSDEMVKLHNQEISVEDILKEHQETPIVELEQVLENSDDAKLNSQTLDGQKNGKVFNTKNLKKAALGGLALFAAYQGVQAFQPQPQEGKFF